MTDWVNWFRSQLQASADGLVWAAKRIDPACIMRLPPRPGYLGTWPPARHVWHIGEYERCLGLPSMQQWIGGPLLEDDSSWPDDDPTWATAQHQPFERFLADFQTIRNQQIMLLDQLVDVDWEAPRPTLWGEQPLATVVTKTFQHTYEHGDTLLRMAMWWKDFEAREARMRASTEAK